MNSVEFLENMLEPGLKKTLIPIAETAMLESVSTETITHLKVKLPDERTCFEQLLEGRDPKLKLAVFQLIVAIGKPEYLELIRPFAESPQPKVKEMAGRILADLG